MSNGIKAYLIIVSLLQIIHLTIVMIYLKKGRNYKEEIESLEEPNINEEQFYKSFNIICDYCNKEFNTSNKTCPHCGGAYHNNKLYLEEIKKRNIEYYNYLQNLQNEIEKKFDTYCSVMKDLKKNIFVNHSFFNFTIKYPKREKIEKTSITCEYCGSNIELNIYDEANCSNCGSSCKDNNELKAYKKMNEVIDIDHEKYSNLNLILSNQNENNKKFDKFMTFHYWFAKLYFALTLLLPIIPAKIISDLPPDSSFIKSFNSFLKILSTVTNYIPIIIVLFIIYIVYKKKK